MSTETATKRTRARTPNNKTTTGFRISDELWAVMEPMDVCRWMSFGTAVFYTVTYRGPYATVVELRPTMTSTERLYMITTVAVHDTGA
jgi:hypothetical protein